MNHYPDPELDDPADDMPALPAGEMPEADQLPATEPSGPPAATSDPFGITLITSHATVAKPVPNPGSPPKP